MRDRGGGGWKERGVMVAEVVATMAVVTRTVVVVALEGESVGGDR